jgi:hypothetical protein
MHLKRRHAFAAQVSTFLADGEKSRLSSRLGSRTGVVVDSRAGVVVGCAGLIAEQVE